MTDVTEPGHSADSTTLVHCENCGRDGWHTTDRCLAPPTDVQTGRQDDLPPASVSQRLGDAVNWIDVVRADLNTVIRELSDDTPMFAIVDIVNALWNLRNASVLLDKAGDTLEADAQAVQR